MKDWKCHRTKEKDSRARAGEFRVGSGCDSKESPADSKEVRMAGESALGLRGARAEPLGWQGGQAGDRVWQGTGQASNTLIGPQAFLRVRWKALEGCEQR